MGAVQVATPTASPLPEKFDGDVVVVGGGISGIQASLDLANSGFKVFLIDKSPAIGGHMAKFDKVFPTNDCSMCIESPKFIECDRHPNIEILTSTEVESLQGKAGDFTVQLVKQPKYVDEEKCHGCGICEQYCPVKIPNGYNQNLSNTKAAHIQFAQAVPLVSHIDPTTCRFLVDGSCNICAGVCENKAINLHQKEERLIVRVGAIILAPGYEIFDPSVRSDYGYGKLTNVVTSLEFERMLNADGPFKGSVIRLSDGKHPKKIAWIQCVGSRQVREGGKSYCSAVCCMYTSKQVILAKEHEEELEAMVFHNDIRAFGKEYEQFYERAKALPGVSFVKSYVSLGREIPESNNVTIKYTANGAVVEEEFEMVVLSVGLTPPKESQQLAEKFGIELNEHGFCKTSEFNLVETTRPGIFVSGVFAGPKDIADSVMTGSSSAALCGELLAERRGKLAQERVYPSERDISQEDPRVGVIVCRCGANIGSVVDIAGVVESAKSLPGVVYSSDMLFACSADSAKRVSAIVREQGLNRVVVAACTPRTHEPLFQDTLQDGGINKYGFVMANIREHCAWVHSREKEKATQKAIDKVRMGVARAVKLQPLVEHELPVNHKGLVVGGGVAGMTAALNLAQQGFEVYLLEKDQVLGGTARRIRKTMAGEDVQTYLDALIRRVYQNPLVHVYTETEILGNSGYVGNFLTKINSKNRIKELDHGVTIVATGAEEYQPTEYLYQASDQVLTLLELEEKLADGHEQVVSAKSVSMILCVGCREENRAYCSRVCCSQAVKFALSFKKQNPAAEVNVFYRDMRTFGFNEDYYRAAADQGVRFLRYTNDAKPQVEIVHEGSQEVVRTTVYEPVLDKYLEIDADLLGLAAPLIPANDTDKIAKIFHVSLSRDGFFLEAHMKLRPVDFASEGIFVCGTAHFPKFIHEAISQANAAAGRAATILSKGKIKSSGAICEVDEDACNGCTRCQKACQYGAIAMIDSAYGKKAEVTAALCQSCGACNAVCPTGAISLNHFTDEQLLTEIAAANLTSARKGRFEPRILAFLCNWCGYAGSDMAGVSRMQYAPNVREVRVMCSSRLNPQLIYEALLQGMDGVLVCGCHLGDCHYMKANEQTEVIVERIRRNLAKWGIDPTRLRQEYVSAAEGAKYAAAVNSFTDQLKQLGPLELTEEQNIKLVKPKQKRAAIGK